ncbi:fatty acid desaturase [Legionella cherrii]|uniref:Fatty acid desaturase n=1 Tax=Legionella cherrii TaxID=28084 RepID=A0ABY6T286_9GAMM|nr:fatty acid desaturase [Legionella cherrii]
MSLIPKNSWKDVKLIKSSVARTLIPPACYNRSYVKTFFLVFFGLISFLIWIESYFFIV